MSVMDFRKIDTLYPDQLQVGDLIMLNDEIVHVIEVAELDNTYAIFYFDEYEEKTFIEVNDDIMIDLYMID